jgi:diguanylate cyclase (GGDEF)-like protein
MTAPAPRRSPPAGEAEDDAAAHEALLQFLYMAPIGLVQIGNDGAVSLMNPMAASLLMSLDAASDLDNLFHVLEPFAPGLRERAAQGPAALGSVGEPVRIRFPGTPDALPSEARTLSVGLFRLDASRLMAVLRDATGEVAQERRVLKAAAHRDVLTEMPNRAAVRDYIQVGLDAGTDASARQRHCAVLFLNIDRFKQINDSLGYAAGDEVLTLLANRLRSALRHGARARGARGRDPIAARLGGDEFVVVLDDLARSDDVHVVAHRLADVLEQPFGLGSHQLQCTVSIGIVRRPQFHGDADDVLRDAGIAMTEAKRAGGGRCVVFEAQMRERAARRQDMEEQLRTALAQRQLFVVYQPVIGFSRGGAGCLSIERNAGVEALVRWRHPERGVVPPLEFIGIAEECGLIGALGQFVLEEACHQFVAWRAELGPCAPRTLAVNLSRGQLDLPGFVESVADVLRRSGMAARDLQLEITESLAAQDAAIQARLHELKTLGLTLALDDFGTGFSSLSSLHLLPVDTVKIDRSFVSEAVTSAHHRALIEATVRVAASLQMATVAEGIETDLQSRLLCELGCDKGQGYFFARPLEAPQLAAWARAL